MILEGGMIVVASIALTVAHPGLVFGKSWGATSINRKNKMTPLGGICAPRNGAYVGV